MSVRPLDPPAVPFLALPPLKCSLWCNFRNTKQTKQYATNNQLCYVMLCYPHSYKNLKCVFCDTAPLVICRQHLPFGNFPVLINQHDKYSCLWTVTFEDDLWRTMWKLTQWLKTESCLFIICCRGMVAIASRRERAQENNRKQEVCRNLVSQFWGLTVQALVGRWSEWASKHICGCQCGSKQGVMIVWSLDFVYQIVFRMNMIFQKLNLFDISTEDGDVPNHLCPKEQSMFIYQAIVGMVVCDIVRLFCVWWDTVVATEFVPKH